METDCGLRIADCERFEGVMRIDATGRAIVDLKNIVQSAIRNPQSVNPQSAISFTISAMKELRTSGPENTARKPRLLAVFLVLVEHIRMHVLVNRQMRARRLQVLADRRHIDRVCAQVFEQALHFIAAFAEADHEA